MIVSLIDHHLYEYTIMTKPLRQYQFCEGIPSQNSLLFTVTVTSNASRHFKSPLAMGEMPFKTKRASSVPISVVIDTGVNSNQNSP